MTSTFRLPHVPVTSEADTTRDFEQLQVLLSEGLTAANLKAEAVTEAKLAKEAVSESKLTAALVAKLNPGAWTALTLGAKIEETALQQTIRVRTEQGSTSARLRGAPVVKAGETLTAGETLATLPEAFRPAKRLLLSINADAAGVITANMLLVATTGVMTLNNNLAAGAFVLFDGLTWNLT